jgi:hypothetical protein
MFQGSPLRWRVISFEVASNALKSRILPIPISLNDLTGWGCLRRRSIHPDPAERLLAVPRLPRTIKSITTNLVSSPGHEQFTSKVISEIGLLPVMHLQSLRLPTVVD